MNGEKIKQARLEKGLTLLALSIKTKIASSDISAMENGAKKVFPSWKKKLEKALNIKLD